MVRRSFTAVIEKNATWTSNFETEPYEAGWAAEARWFVRISELAAGGWIEIHPQLSPDGLFWCDEGREPLRPRAAGLYSFALRDFGNWLRLRVAIGGEQAKVKLTIYLALKE
jgi:hypothetical protein